MPRIAPLQVPQATGETRRRLEETQQALGMVPNLFKTLARSPVALAAYMHLADALRGALTPRLREQIALAVAGANDCTYCASAHTALGAQVRIDAAELAANLRGRSRDERTQAALRFALAVVEARGGVTDAELERARADGFSDGELVEVVALVALNVFTNYVNRLADPDVDFPLVETAPSATRART